MYELTEEEIKYQIKYVFDNNPDLPTEVLLEPIVKSSCQAQVTKVLRLLSEQTKRAVKKERERIFEEIEYALEFYQCSLCDTDYILTSKKWQALKAESGVKDE